MKPYVAELYREQTVGEFTENHPDKVVLPVVETALTAETPADADDTEEE